MAGIDDVLERLINDGAFREQLARDPEGALAPYKLSAEDRTLLAARFSADAGGTGRVEQRTSKSALAGLIGAVGGGREETIFKGEAAGIEPAPSGSAQVDAVFNPKEVAFSKSMPSSDAPTPSDLTTESTDSQAYHHRPAKVDALAWKMKNVEGPNAGGADALHADPTSAEGTFDGKYAIANATHAAGGSAAGTDLAPSDDDPQKWEGDWHKDFVVDGQAGQDKEAAGVGQHNQTDADFIIGRSADTTAGDDHGSVGLFQQQVGGSANTVDEPSPPEPVKEKFTPAKPHINVATPTSDSDADRR